MRSNASIALAEAICSPAVMEELSMARLFYVRKTLNPLSRVGQRNVYQMWDVLN